MLDWFLELLKNPNFQAFVLSYGATKLLDAAGSKIKQLKSKSNKATPEWQFLTCLEYAFYTTETQLGWKHQTEAMYESFEDALLSNQNFFTVSSLKEIFEAAVAHSVTEDDLDLWVVNFKRELATGKYPQLLNFLSIDHMLKPQTSSQTNQPNYILTSFASIYDNPEIICRDEFIEDLLLLLSSGHKRIQITGMGGLGKTETLTKLYAKLAVDKQHSGFDHIAFIRFSGDILSDIESQIDYPREYLGLKGIEAAKRFIHDICVEKNVLLCIDDIRANQEIMKQDNPCIQFFRSLGASIVFAARAGLPDFERNDLSFLSTKACIELFEKKFGRSVWDGTDIEILIDIIENRAGNHTLIINRLGNMAKDYGWSIPKLAERLKEKDFSFRKGIADEELLQLEINKLYQFNDELSAAEKNILEAFSIFPATPLSVDLCVVWLHEDADVDEDNCLFQLNKLAEKTWLEKHYVSDGNDAVSFQLHHLIKHAINNQTVVDFSSHEKLVIRSILSLQQSLATFEYLFAAEIIPFIKSLYAHLSSNSVLFSRVAAKIGDFYFHKADFAKAIHWYSRGYTISSSTLGLENPDSAIFCNNLAVVFNNFGDFTGALEWYKKVIETDIKIYGSSHPTIATTYSNMGVVYYYSGDCKSALEYYEKAEDIQQNTVGRDSYEIAITKNNIALAIEMQEDQVSSLDRYMDAYMTFIKTLNSDHPFIATVCSNIAMAWQAKGDYIQALDWYNKSLEINERVFGIESSQSASIYHRIGTLFDDQGQYDTALKWLNKALEIRESILGEKSVTTARSYNYIATINIKLNNYTEALRYLFLAMKIREDKLGFRHPDTATTYNNISATYFKQGDHNSSLIWRKKALQIEKDFLGISHPKTLLTEQEYYLTERLISQDPKSEALDEKKADQI